MKRAIIFVLLAFLAGCDDGPAIRKALAECMISDKNLRYGRENLAKETDWFLEQCMQAKGYILDETIQPDGHRNLPCSKRPFPALEPKCYRPDIWWSGLLAKKSN